MHSSNQFWKNKPVLVTGINGFVGSHLAKALESKGANVWGISRSREEKNILKADIAEFSSIDKIIKEKNISIVFHLAAESLVEAGQKDPYRTFKVNTMGTLNILESAKKNNIDRVIATSTTHVYGDNKVPFKEEYFPRPSRPYETSKTCMDLISQCYADTFDLPVLIPRFCNTYGPGDMNLNRLIPKTIKSVLQGERPQMWGGGALRDFIYVDDVVSAYLKLATMPMEKFEQNRIFNFGTESRANVKQIIQMILDISQSDMTIEIIQDARTDEIKKQYVSSEKAQRVLDWTPKTNLEEGLKKTIAWYKKNLPNL